MPPRGGQRAHADVESFFREFQYMPPRGGQPVMPSGSSNSPSFQYMPPRGGQHGNYFLQSFHHGFQYMPPRGGQHVRILFFSRKCRVSIHAPTRGATPSGSSNPSNQGFQYMPPRGGQPPRRPARCTPRCFNTCPHAGGNRTRHDAQRFPRWVSIHAPTRGATELVRMSR